MDEDRAWDWLRSRVGRNPEAAASGPEPILACSADRGQDQDATASADRDARDLLDLYLPLCPDPHRRLVVAHLGQSLDGRIAAANGASRWVTGAEDVAHNHRMRALFDAVLVGAGTVEADDPQLTVRAVRGSDPVRVVLDTGRRLGGHHRVFRDGAARTLLLCDQAVAGEARLGQAEVMGIESKDGSLPPRAILDRLAEIGLRRIFIEGGGITVSRFLAAECLDRLQIAIAPLIIGSGRPSITLPEIAGPSAGLRPPTRSIVLGSDILVECRFGG